MWDVDNGRATEDNATQYTIGDLKPFTVYSFRVVAVNALGMSQPSKESYFMITLRECELLGTFVDVVVVVVCFRPLQRIKGTVQLP